MMQKARSDAQDKTFWPFAAREAAVVHSCMSVSTRSTVLERQSNTGGFQ